MRKDFQEIREELCKDYQNTLDRLSKANFGKAGLTKKQIETMMDAYRQGISDALIKVEPKL